MWARNLLFCSIIFVGVAVLVAQLTPQYATRHDEQQLTEIQQTRRRAARLDPVSRQVGGALKTRWQEAGVKAVATADDLTVARRISLALVGTIPSLEEIRWLEALPDDVRLELWVDRLMRDRRFADYLAERLARAYVGVDVGPFFIYRRRRFFVWLADQIYANRPYDDLVRELIASEGLWTGRPATNFLTVTINPNDNVGHPDEVKLAGRVARAFLGVRIDCAQCHDHPFDDWTQKDFHALAAFFGQTEQTFTGISDGKRQYLFDNGGRQPPEAVEPRVPFSEDLLPAKGRLRQRLAAWVTSPKNTAFAHATVNRIWAMAFGRPLVEPLDNLPIGEKVPKVLDVLSEDFVEHGYDLQRLLRVIFRSEAFRLASRDTDSDPGDSKPSDERVADLAGAWALFPIERLLPIQLAQSIIQAASLKTINHSSHILIRTVRLFDQGQFINRYGDPGGDEFMPMPSTIAQRLLMLNGKLVQEKVKSTLFNASGLIAQLAPDDRRAIETAYLTVLSRLPTPEELAHFRQRLTGDGAETRAQCIEDLFWTLINSTEFSWNH